MNTSPPAPPTVTVVTGPAGVDIGPVVAWLGRDLGDGLAIRTVVSPATGMLRYGAHEHTSPTPEGTVTVGTGTPYPRVPLWNLPSCWQNPDTNLGVAYTGIITRDLEDDIDTLRSIGWDPSHRVSVSRRNDQDPSGGDHRVPQPVEIGDLAAAARDSVLRAADGGSRHVLIEAGDGQTFLDAFHAIGLAPWEPAIKRLHLWLVVDAAGLGHTGAEQGLGGGTPDERGRTVLLDQLIATTRELLAANGGGAPLTRNAPVTMFLAVLNGHLLLPALTHVDTEAFLNINKVSLADADAFSAVVGRILDGTGVPVDLFGTHTAPDTFITLD